jgi:serine/threonine protein kinase
MIVEELLKRGDTLRGNYGEYTILNLVGRGGMGVVYKVQRADDASEWALKEMRPPPNTPDDEVAENRTLFEQEADLMSRLDHPNLPVLTDRFLFEGRPVMVMEYVPGQTLEAQMQDTNAPMLKQEALQYGIQLCRVLDYLHNLKPQIIYRDLKPPNIMITPRGVLKLIDFGVARTYKARKAKDTIAMGSAGYAPPEQYGKGQTDPRSDIYALGATLLHLLTNAPPIPLQPPQAGAVRTMNPSVDEQTEQVIIKAMSLDRAQRYTDCKAMEAALRECLDAPYIDPTANVQPPPVRAQPAPAAPPPAAPVPLPDAGGKVCNNCGYNNKEAARFCANCGTPLTSVPAARLRVASPRSTWEMRVDSDIPCRIGRRDPKQSHYPELDLAEHDRGIASRHHATIQRSDDFYTLTDLGSTNGTYVNGTRIASFTPQRLHPGDMIKIGEVEIEFRWA